MPSSCTCPDLAGGGFLGIEDRGLANPMRQVRRADPLGAVDIGGEPHRAFDQIGLHRRARLHGRDRLLDPLFQLGGIFLGQHRHDRAGSHAVLDKSSTSPSIFLPASAGPCSESRFFDSLQFAQAWPWLRILRCMDQIRRVRPKRRRFVNERSSPGIIASPPEKVAAAVADFLALRRRTAPRFLAEGSSFRGIVPKPSFLALAK